MPREIFVDATAWVALADTGDGAHNAAVAAYPGIERRFSWVTTNLVIAEAQIIIRRRGGQRAGMQFLTQMRSRVRLVKVYSDENLETSAEEILRRYADQDFSLTDAVSFALMRQRGITEAFTFDRHFLIAGFILIPGIYI